jgi:hypothetical protein
MGLLGWPPGVVVSYLLPGLLLGLPASAAAQAPTPVALIARVDGPSLVLSVVASAPLAVTHHVEGDEWLATFDSPVRVELAAGLLESTAGWIGGVQSGYDTLLIRAARAVDFEVSRRDDGIDLRLTARGPADPEADAEGQRRLALLRAQWHAAQGAGAAELRMLSMLERQAPADAQVLTALGSAERRIGWRRRALATFERARAADRADPEVRRQLADMAVERAPRLRMDLEHKDVHGEWQTASQRSEGVRALSDAVQVRGRLELLRFDAARVRRPSGEIGPLRRALQRGDAWLDIETRGGTTWSAAVCVANSGPGLAAGFVRPQPSGRWTLEAEWHRPFWEFAEGLADGGTRDRGAVERRQKLARRLDGWVVASVNRYAIDDGANTRTAGVSGGVVVALRTAAPAVSASYGLDKESVLGQTQRIAPDGSTFAPVPIVSREIHVPGVQVRQAAGRALVIDGHAGYAMDRLGGRGLVAEVHARWPRGRVTGEVWLDRRLQTFTTTTVVTRIGGGVAVRF